VTRRLVLALCLAAAAAGPAAAGEFSDEFDRQRFKDAFAHEIAFREAAIHVAWGAEPLCDDTQEIEPFVLWSTRTLRKGLDDHKRRLFTQATGMDEHWRVAWLDEAAPEELAIGTRVVAVNGRPLPAPGTKFEIAAIFRRGSTMSVDDQGFWTVMHQARAEANESSSMTLTLEGGRSVKVPTQTGCAGAVVATAFDDEPENFQRQDGMRSKIPGHALMAARERDEFRWLAAFGTYFVASEHGVRKQRSSESVGSAFTIGKVLALAVPGAGTVLTAIEAQAQRSIQVDGLVGSADLFANEVVMAMGGNPAAGLRLSDRLKAAGTKADVLVLDDFRRSNVEIHLKSLAAIAEARRRAEQEAERAAEAADSAETAKRAAATPR
jgi:hypothetical protein